MSASALAQSRSCCISAFSICGVAWSQCCTVIELKMCVVTFSTSICSPLSTFRMSARRRAINFRALFLRKWYSLWLLPTRSTRNCSPPMECRNSSQVCSMTYRSAIVLPRSRQAAWIFLKWNKESNARDSLPSATITLVASRDDSASRATNSRSSMLRERDLTCAGKGTIETRMYSSKSLLATSTPSDRARNISSRILIRLASSTSNLSIM